jgi:hypothetical protein
MSMRTSSCIVFAFALVTAACSELPTEPAVAPATPEPGLLSAGVAPPFIGCVDGTLPGGALSRICFPPDWNGDAVIWAHGYTSVFEPLAIPDDEVGGQSIQNIVLGLRYAYATTSYRANGLVAVAAVDDLSLLSQAVEAATGNATRFKLLVGASEGGLATALALERSAQHFDGGLIACAPVGNFRAQVNYLGDVRVLFDYFFPGVLPGSPISIPADLINNWETVYQPAVAAALLANPGRTAQLIRTAALPVDPANPASAGTSVLAALWYNVFATNDARAKLGGGNPYDNRTRIYAGSTNDFLLNLLVRRFRADASALTALRPFEATGALRRPAQQVHTRLDPVIPFWQSQVYQLEALFNSGLNLLSSDSPNYGHCAFDLDEVLGPFAVLVLRVTGLNLIASASVFPDVATARRFEQRAQDGGAQPLLLRAEGALR